MNSTPRKSPFSSKSIRWWILFGVCLVGVLVLAVLTAPMFIRSQPNRPLTEAVNNLRHIGLALVEFATAYGTLPDAHTAATVREHTETTLALGTQSSNEIFRQLFAAEVCQSEAMFYARIQGTHKPDNEISGNQALAKGEVAFTYLLGATQGCNPARPVIVAPMIPGTDRFDPKPFEGKAVVLRADNSVTSVAIDKQGHAIFEGKNLMDPAHPVWQGKPPIIAWPDL